MNKEELIDKHELSRRMGLGVSTIQRWCGKGEIPFIRINERGDKRFFYSEVLKALEEKYN